MRLHLWGRRMKRIFRVELPQCGNGDHDRCPGRTEHIICTCPHHDEKDD